MGTEWRLTAKGCSWRNGLAERIIRSARHTLAAELRRGALLDFHHFGAVLSVVGSIINARPLSIRTSSDGEYHAISPRDVLLGRSLKSLRRTEEALEFTQSQDDDQLVAAMEDSQAKIVVEWQKKWLGQVFPDMVGRTKWRTAKRNLRIGDIGHVRYQHQVGEDLWRLARIVKVKVDEDGHIRTIVVEFRPRHVADKTKPYVKKPGVNLEIGVQRFSVLLPVEEQQGGDVPLEDPSPALPPPMSEMTLN